MFDKASKIKLTAHVTLITTQPYTMYYLLLVYKHVLV